MQIRLLIALLIVALWAAIYTALWKSSTTGQTSSQPDTTQGSAIEIVSAGKEMVTFFQRTLR